MISYAMVKNLLYVYVCDRCATVNSKYCKLMMFESHCLIAPKKIRLKKAFRLIFFYYRASRYFGFYCYYFGCRHRFCFNLHHNIKMFASQLHINLIFCCYYFVLLVSLKYDECHRLQTFVCCIFSNTDFRSNSAFAYRIKFKLLLFVILYMKLSIFNSSFCYNDKASYTSEFCFEHFIPFAYWARNPKSEIHIDYKFLIEKIIIIECDSNFN